MIIVGTHLRIVDNSGAKTAQCIRLLNKSNKKLAKIGDYVVVSVKSLKRNLPKKKVSIGQVLKAVVVGRRNPVNRKAGFVLKRRIGSAVLLDRDKLLPIGTRITPGVPNEIRIRGLVKILTLAKGLI